MSQLIRPASSINSSGNSWPVVAGAPVTYEQVPLSIPQMVAAWATETPATAAIVTEDQTLDYAELDRRANRLANRLLDLGAGPDQIVALCLERSVYSIVCALAVLKCGSAYLPIDPSQPAERIASMLRDAAPRALITRRDLSPALAQEQFSTLIEDDLDSRQFSAERPVVNISDDQLAYVIYTSGSTGQPKGVEVTHANLMNLVTWHRDEFAVRATDKASCVASVGFDAAVWEVWPYLTAGATLYLPSEETRVSPELLRDWLVANQISISFLPTALAERVMLLDWPGETALRFLLTGADTLHRYPEQSLPFQLINNYGPTECTVVATSGRVSPDRQDGLPAIGRAISNATVYILDEGLVPVAPGETGEIYIGGAGVARGYLNQPELTAARFLANPFSTEPHARMYRTGDLARIRPDGELAYVGRVDEQIKIRGYRIEPGEIEAAIDRHAAIAESVVVARGCDCSEQRLTAYLTLRNGTTPSATELRECLRPSLPDYMLPALFVKLDSFPITANGKIDRSLLPEPSVENTLREDNFSAPSSPIEEQLAKIICELFRLQSVSVNDNFFLLGGHSLLGAQLIVKIRSTFGIDLTLRSLFEAPTIAELSREVERLVVARIDSMSEEEALALLN